MRKIGHGDQHHAACGPKERTRPHPGSRTCPTRATTRPWLCASLRRQARAGKRHAPPSPWRHRECVVVPRWGAADETKGVLMRTQAFAVVAVVLAYLAPHDAEAQSKFELSPFASRNASLDGSPI